MNGVDPDQTPRSVASALDSHCLLRQIISSEDNLHVFSWENKLFEAVSM